MRWVLALLLIVHGLAHLMGFAKAFGYAELPQLAHVTRQAGVGWLAAALLMSACAFLVVGWPTVWWGVGLIAILASQIVIATAWRDAWAGTILNVVVLGAVGLSAAQWRWESKAHDITRQLESAGRTREAVYSESELEGLPIVVQKYFRQVLTPGQPIIVHARVRSRGTFNMGEPPAENWKLFTAVQDFYPNAPGFVWNARIRIAPAMNVFVRDAFVDGRGSMYGSILGVKTVVQSGGTPGMAEASLMRYLAEAPWFPTALLPSQAVRWTAMSDRVARAALTSNGTTAALDFRFAEDGLLLGCEALRENDTLHAKFPWGGKFSRWIRKDGMMLPSQAEVAWQLPTGYFAYWRGVVEPSYEFVK
jgi:Family of unknown function (DUF6544)